MNSPENAVPPAAPPRRLSRDAVATAIAAFGLLAVTALAFSPTVRPAPHDVITLLFLAAVAFICFWTPAMRAFESRNGAACFALTVAMFIIYSLAREAGPTDGWVLKFSALPDDRFAISYAARIVVLCAIVTLPAWLRDFNGWVKSLMLGALLIAILSTFIFRFLAGSYTVGVTEVLDPTPLPTLGTQLVEYSALALLCAVVTANPMARKVALRFLPFALLALWARHYFMAAPAVEEAE